jgi:hypothetical protein
MSFRLTSRDFKKQFFTRSITRRANPASVRGLARFGALVRTKARRSIRKRKRSSKPGEAPSGHEGSLKKYIYFAYEPTRGSVVIGPAANKANLTTSGILQRGIATETLEHGGRIGVVEQQFTNGGKWYGVNHRRTRRKADKRRVRWVTMRPRPYMAPAFNSTLPIVSTFWKNSIKG